MQNLPDRAGHIDVPALISAAHAARLAGVSLGHFVKVAPVPIIRLGYRRYVVEAELRGWLEALRDRATS